MPETFRSDDHEELTPVRGGRANAGRRIEAVLERELAQEAERASGRGNRDVKDVALELREKAISEIAESEHREESRRRLARIYQFVDYFFFVAYALIGMLIALELMGARDRSGFMRFMHAITAPLVAPFKGVMPDPSVGSFQLMLSYVIALIAYLLLHSVVRRFFELMARRQPKEL
ncbi:MAG: hypothetical protein WC538_03075 [Thermoanaerobaculia bacterium]